MSTIRSILEKIEQRMAYREEVTITRDEFNAICRAIPLQKIKYRTFEEAANAIRKGSGELPKKEG